MTDKFNTFAEIQYKPLRIFNCTVMMNNIFNDEGRSRAKEYIEQFDDTFRKQMYVMQAWIQKFGYDSARRAVTKGVPFSDEDHQGDPVQ